MRACVSMCVYKSSVNFRIWFRLRISVTFFDEIYARVFLSHHSLRSLSLSVVGFSKLTHSVSLSVLSLSISIVSFIHTHSHARITQAHMRNVSVEYNRQNPKKRPKKKILINFRPDSFSLLKYEPFGYALEKHEEAAEEPPTTTNG